MWEWVASALALVAAGATFVVGLTVWFGEQKNYLRIPFLWLTIFVAAWIAGNVIFAIGLPEHRFAVALISYPTAMLVAVQTLYFVLKLTRQKPSRVIWLCLALGYIIAALSVLPGVVGKEVEGTVIHTNPAGIILYGVVLSIFLLSACVLLVWRLRRANRILRRQIRLILTGIALSSVIGLTFNLALPIVGNYNFIQLGPAGAVVFIIAVAYAVARYSLFDVRLAIVRGVAYLATFATLAGSYFVIAFLVAGALNSSFIASDQTPLNIVAALVIALLLQPVKRFFDKLTGRIFYHDNYDTDAFFAEVNKALSSSTDLRGMLQRTARSIANNLKSEQVFFFVYTEDDHFVVSGTEKHARPAKKDVQEIDEFVLNREVADDVVQASAFGKHDHLKRLLLSYRIELLIPLLQEGKIVGYMCIGERRSGGYTRRDIRLLGTIVDELLIAIQNALAVQQVRELNASLEQRVEAATRELRASNAQLQRLDEAKDEFISMASHQLRTPLTSIKGYISMIMEGDVGKVSPEQKHLLREAFISSERMVRLIGDFLNVSRLQTGKFVIEKRSVDLAKLVAREIDGLEPNAAARGLKFSYAQPKHFPLLELDENKIQQVIMNFADNAIYYSKDNSKITVSLKADKSHVEFTVKDTGIGVPEAQQDQLFNKFFRATNARRQRPDGTGVGLFLAKKVIDAHYGEIIFSSKENKGSTFGFRLPIARLRAADDADKLVDQPAKH